MEHILLWAAAGIAVLAVVRIFTLPLRRLVRFLLHALLGFAGLLLVNLLGGRLGFSLGVNLLNALTVGILGLPGLALLLLLRWYYAL